MSRLEDTLALHIRAAGLPEPEREYFACQYCGKTPPAVVLEVDHIIPVSSGGSDDIDNLTTACFDCNRGKGKVSLNLVPQTLSEKADLLREKEAQLAQLEKLVASKRKRIKKECDILADTFCERYYPMHFTRAFLDDSMVFFLERLPFHEVEDAMRMTCNRIERAESASKYFCGICWKKIRGER